MALTVKYFASLREQLGRDQDQLDADDCCTVDDVWAQVSGSTVIPENVLIAVNLEYVQKKPPGPRW